VLIATIIHSSGKRISAAWDRDEGIGSTRDGQAVPNDELRARVVIWPPSRLTLRKLFSERGRTAARIVTGSAVGLALVFGWSVIVGVENNCATGSQCSRL
jgi:hypothetical protein